MVGRLVAYYLESPLLLMSGSQNMPCHIVHWLCGVAAVVVVVGKVVVVVVALTFEIEASDDDDRYRM